MCYHPSGYIIFNLRELKFYEGTVSDMRAGGPNNRNTHI